MGPTHNEPDLLPILSRGKHRNPRKGACFMELASYLAGERWSDHPPCTHPLVAELARLVNDYTTDAGRPQLAPLIPSVIGLATDDPHLDATVALGAATTALPLSSASRQGCLAVGILASERVLARLDGRSEDVVTARSIGALEQVPQAYRWALQFTHHSRVSLRNFQRRGAPGVVRCSVDGIAHGTSANLDTVLRELLKDAIASCDKWRTPTPAPTVTTESPEWADACRLSTGTRRRAG
ncbi:MAG: hypothetical protein ACRDPG_11195 [Nocardioidaceae bacterium]